MSRPISGGDTLRGECNRVGRLIGRCLRRDVGAGSGHPLEANSYYAARNNLEQLRIHCSDVAALDGRDLDPKAAYVVDDKILAVWLAPG